jgi:hypothetical protein
MGCCMVLTYADFLGPSFSEAWANLQQTWNNHVT